MYAVEPGAGNRLVTSSGWESVTFLLPPDRRWAHLTARPPRERVPLAERCGAAAGRLRARARAVRVGASGWCHAAMRQPWLFDEQGQGGLAAQDELLELLLATLHVAGDFASRAATATRKATARS